MKLRVPPQRPSNKLQLLFVAVINKHKKLVGAMLVASILLAAVPTRWLSG